MTHEHEHTHDGDSSHDHGHGSGASVRASAAMPAGLLSFIAAGTAPDPDHGHEHDTVALVAASMSRLGSSWGVAQAGEGDWRVLAADGSVRWSAGSYTEALTKIAEQLAAAQGTAVLSDTWRSDMAFEAVSTGDGRRILAGGIQYRDTPLPLMLQTETEVGHFGAVLAGAITQTGKVGTTAVGTGTFDDSEAGNQFVSIIQARGKFGVSIDVAEAEGEFECTETDEEGYCTDGEMVFSMVRVMGLTGTPFPAFEDAYIELAQQAGASAGQEAAEQLAAAAEPCADCLPEGTHDGTHPGLGHPATADGSVVTLVAAAPAAPPLEWFANPGFVEGDPRLVRQPDGHLICPLTIDGRRAFGHLAGWFTCHTSFPGQCVTAPRSRTGYAAFMLRPLMTADGEVVKVGHLTMGAGHADDSPSTPLAEVRAHYDGGPGAVQLASVCVGEDQFGVWFAGAINPEVTDEQIARARTLSVSGDWRTVWKGRGMDLVAVAAGITVPGFPITSMAASGGAAEPLLGPARVRFLDGTPVVLVAAGAVRQPAPWERMIAHQAGVIEELTVRLENVERVTGALRPLAAERLVASTKPAA